MDKTIASLLTCCLLLCLCGFSRSQEQTDGTTAEQSESTDSTTAKPAEAPTNEFCVPDTTSAFTAISDTMKPNLYQLVNQTTDDALPVPVTQLDLLGSSGPAVKDYLLRKHNCLRSQAPAANMLELQWNDEVAGQAQQWADGCVYAHNSDANRTTSQFPCGQNIASAAGSPISWNRVMNLWYNEVNYYAFNGSNSDAVVGHYTQVVWAATWQLGCAYKDCGSFHFYVCNYGPRGNVPDPVTGDVGAPYLPGPACSACPNSCSNGRLCTEGCPAVDYMAGCDVLAKRRNFCTTQMGRSCQATCQCKGTEQIY